MVLLVKNVIKTRGFKYYIKKKKKSHEPKTMGKATEHSVEIYSFSLTDFKKPKADKCTVIMFPS